MANSVRYYFAYGSNLSKEQMFARCPDSEYLTSGVLADYCWFINERGYANIRPSEGDFVLGEIFSLSEKDVELLDVYESVPEGMYHHEVHDIQAQDSSCDCLVYVDLNQVLGEPQFEYIKRINRGVQSASLPMDYVNKYIRPFIPSSSDV
ncbi:MAG TPA: gamma-glutamylcyclotransferase [Candidatus Thioglobus sp.]|nr:gamma-glutamylcyclotransferase [Candidatus Thioglobus sp.]HIL20223.1 gamma-glutamylcyclotransferase [Candidatus Thioglobus sp.]